MKTYLVRYGPTHEMVGIFIAKNPYQLWMLIDETMDPSECEFINLGAGGLCWQFEEMPKIPIALRETDEGDYVAQHDSDDAEFPSLDGLDKNPFEITEEWSNEMYQYPGRKPRKWTNFGSVPKTSGRRGSN